MPPVIKLANKQEEITIPNGRIFVVLKAEARETSPAGTK